MEAKRSTINYIFYLQTKPELDNTFILLSEIMNKLNISLLPITADELKTLDKNSKNHIIFVRNEISSGLLFNQLRKTFFDMALLTGKVFLYDVSSFSELDNAQKLQNKEVYRYVPLPANLKQVAMTIAIDFFKDRNKQEEWPGGRRAKLPSMNTQN
jgi:hypothetical protein